MNLSGKQKQTNKQCHAHAQSQHTSLRRTGPILAKSPVATTFCASAASAARSMRAKKPCGSCRLAKGQRCEQTSCEMRRFRNSYVFSQQPFHKNAQTSAKLDPSLMSQSAFTRTMYRQLPIRRWLLSRQSSGSSSRWGMGRSSNSFSTS